MPPGALQLTMLLVILTVLLVVQVQQELGVQIIPYQDTIVDMATTLIQNGMAKPQKQ